MKTGSRSETYIARHRVGRWAVLGLSWQIAAALAMASALGACRPPPVYYVVGDEPSDVAVPHRPPPPLQEDRGQPPGDGYVWRGGYWNWDGEQYAWIDGRWEQPPASGYVFFAPSYTLYGGRWRYRPCYWAPRSWRPRRRVHPRAHARYHHDHGAVSPPLPAGAPTHQRVAAPAAGDAPGAPTHQRVAAPAAGDAPGAPTHRRVRAPAATHSERGAAVAARAAAESGGAGPAHPRVIRLGPRLHRSGARPVSAAGSRISPDRRKRLEKRTDYRGERDGRMAFGDDPAGSPRYRTDETGAIVLATSHAARATSHGPVRSRPAGHRSGRRHHGRLIVVRGDDDARDRRRRPHRARRPGIVRPVPATAHPVSRTYLTGHPASRTYHTASVRRARISQVRRRQILLQQRAAVMRRARAQRAMRLRAVRQMHSAPAVQRRHIVHPAARFRHIVRPPSIHRARPTPVHRIIRPPAAHRVHRPTVVHRAAHVQRVHRAQPAGALRVAAPAHKHK